MNTYVYVDGFNLYYGSLRASPYRWLDLAKLCQLMLPSNRVCAIKYFTALVKARPGDPQQPVRQQAYLRALRTLPGVSIVLGHFLSHHVQMLSPSGEYVRVIKTEEKGSDVNLATHLLCDGFENAYDAAVVISNDSDLMEPVRVVRERLKKVVGILNPQRHPSRQLLSHATFFKTIRPGVLAKSLFPDMLTDEHGTFHKPPGW